MDYPWYFVDFSRVTGKAEATELLAVCRQYPEKCAVPVQSSPNILLPEIDIVSRPRHVKSARVRFCRFSDKMCLFPF
jgi:hypothetical protein